MQEPVSVWTNTSCIEMLVFHGHVHPANASKPARQSSNSIAAKRNRINRVDRSRVREYDDEDGDGGPMVGMMMSTVMMMLMMRVQWVLRTVTTRVDDSNDSINNSSGFSSWQACALLSEMW